MACKRKIECTKCEDGITANNFKRHIEKCDGIPRHQCISKYAGNRGGWNRGIKLVDLLNSGEITNEEYEHRINSSRLGGLNSPGQPYSHEDRLLRNAKLRESAFRNKLGGHTSKIRLYYKCVDGSEVYMQSSYEIKFAELLDNLV